MAYHHHAVGGDVEGAVDAGERRVVQHRDQVVVVQQLQAGVVWQNTYNHFDPTAAFGGYKESGFGREGGAAGLRPYVRVS